jgi:hypothetical protein
MSNSFRDEVRRSIDNLAARRTAMNDLRAVIVDDALEEQIVAFTVRSKATPMRLSNRALASPVIGLPPLPPPAPEPAEPDHHDDREAVQ